ncbi:DUF6389 family protein [Streptomyces microflavus]|uniref:DUF6389 family protein n=1 Tax=Streptomyces TaxID=1883 RepID=UPI001C59996B|nr:DUF6389 family protein [Streptomyces sp. 09ZI22]MBW3356617.1 hypothetical protein [Streptomyces sp. 09ZI22]
MEPNEHQDADGARYRAELRRVLDTSSPSVVRRLEAIRDIATAGTDGVTIGVFPDQESHGTFAVWARFSGADSFALDRQIGDERELFKVLWTDNGWEPAVPEPPASWSTLHLENVLFDTVAEWIELLIPPYTTDLQWEVTTPDGTQDHRPVGPSH